MPFHEACEPEDHITSLRRPHGADMPAYELLQAGTLNAAEIQV